jgi:release factor glutamine methyltransferase
MNLRQALEGAARELAVAGEDHGRGEAELLLGRLLSASRAELYLRGDEPFDTGHARTLAAWILRRQGGEPLQYIVGEAAYRDLVLEVGPGVFIPRPETELLVDEALAFLAGLGRARPRLLECGTGSGAIALSLALERPDAVVVATEL